MMPICVMPEPPVFVDWPKDYVNDRTTTVLMVVDFIHREGDDCASNNNVVCEKKPFNPVLATYAWEGWVD